MKQIILTLLCLFGITQGYAQINFPKISPHCELTQEVGLSELKVIYSRPGVRKRNIVGDLMPYGRIWRVGANESTKFTISDDFKVNGHSLPGGTYALYAFPQKDEWEIVFHKNLKHWGDGRTNYDPKEDALRFKVKPEKTKDFRETFMIEFDEITHNSAQMLWLWENTRISFKIEVDTHKKVMEEISKQIKENPTADTYYQSARYLQEQGKEYEKARGWLIKAHELAGEKYYINRVRSLVEAALSNYKSALQYAKKSREIAEELGKDEFVRLNDKNIEKWEKMVRK